MANPSNIDGQTGNRIALPTLLLLLRKTKFAFDLSKPDLKACFCRLPVTIPADTAIPGWAYQNVTITGTFEIGEALANNIPESTAISSASSSTTSSRKATSTLTASLSSSHPSSTSSPSSSVSSSSSSSHTVAIVGGIVGGVVGAAALGVLAFLLGRRTSTQSAAMSDRKGTTFLGSQTTPLMNEKEDSNGSGRFSPPQALTQAYEPPRFYVSI